MIRVHKSLTNTVTPTLTEQMNRYLLIYHPKAFVVVRSMIMHIVMIYMYIERGAPA